MSRKFTQIVLPSHTECVATPTISCDELVFTDNFIV